MVRLLSWNIEAICSRCIGLRAFVVIKKSGKDNDFIETIAAEALISRPQTPPKADAGSTIGRSWAIRNFDQGSPRGCERKAVSGHESRVADFRRRGASR
jgi:hypothetical protein